MARLSGTNLFADLADLAAVERKPDVDVDEHEDYRRDPFSHLDSTEAWTDPEGWDWNGHIFVPQISTGEVGALVPMEHQVDFAEEWIDLDLLHNTGELRFRNVHIEKSRQMGMTWWLAYLVWWTLTYHDVAGGYSNLNAAEVDDGGEASTSDSFFGKVRFIQEHVPARFRAPLGFRGGNAPLIRHRGRPSFIIGRGAVMNPGRGGTYRYWIVDEAARFPHGEAAHAALDRAVPNGRVLNSTPAGEANVYYRLADSRPQGWRFVSYHWNDHPLYGAGKHVAAFAPTDLGDPGGMAEQANPEEQKAADSCEACKATMLGIRWEASNPIPHRYPGKMTSPWYERAIVGLNDDQVASELDIDYAGSLPARVYTEFSDLVHVVPHIAYVDHVGIEFAFDYGLDVTAVAILQDLPTEIIQIGELEVADATPDEVCRALLTTMAQIGIPSGLLKPHVTGNMLAIGDPAGDYREVGSNKSIASKYAENSFNIVAPKPQAVAKTILNTKRILNGRPKRYRVSGDTCPKTVKHWKLNRWPVDRDGNRKPGATHPVDDQANHILRALAYYCSYKYPSPEIEDELEAALQMARLAQSDGIGTLARYGMQFAPAIW